MTQTRPALLQAKYWAMLGILALIVLMAVACGSSGDKAADQELRIRINTDVTTFDPQLAVSADEISVAKQLYRGLFTYDSDLSVIPSIAQELPTIENGGISEDGLTYTIKLRDDAAWSDGQAVVAADFVYAFQRLVDPNAGGQGIYSSYYTAITGANDAYNGEGDPANIGVSAPDDHTLVLELDYAQPTLVTLLALWPASPLRQDLIDANGDAWTQPGTLVTNGPFVLASYESGVEIGLERNAAYWGDDAPQLEHVSYKIIEDDDAALIAYQNGEIDMTSIPLEVARQYEDSPDRVHFTQMETMALQYNVTQAPFDNKLVRQAFSHALDRDLYVQTLLSGVGTPALGWLPEGLPNVSANPNTVFEFNAQAGNDLLADAGFTDSSFPTVTILIPDDDTYQTVAEFVQDQLDQNLGVDVEIEVLESNAYGERWFNGEFELTLFDFFGDYADPENWLPQQFASDGGYNVTGYSNPQVDELFSQAATATDTATRISLYEQAHDLIIEDQALTPIYHPERNYLVKQNIDGLGVTPLDAQPGDWFLFDVTVSDQAGAPASNPDE
jgi:oligopeptide transport system substrate-binding protein